MSSKRRRSEKTVITLTIVAAVLGVSYGVQKYQSYRQVQKLHQLVAGEFHLDSRTKTTGCKVDNGLPDHACTPGAVFASVTKTQVCTSGYSSTVRDVPTSEKDTVYSEYGITSHKAGQYEIDHFISLELGGSNDIANLWPEAASPTPGFHQKDEVEDYLHKQMCSGTISLKEAQALISKNWLQVYDCCIKKTAVLSKIL